ncbi:DUF4913 domain-containing protein [Streptodolium elevatio]|uniref:DUF4913 domain-containing protein n=1 Tax=Streptodolium elevatio TaxID=3157996 RepID=A0ABV3D822_9ACTN
MSDTAAAVAEDEYAEADMVFASLDEFVTRYVAQIVRRRLGRSVAMWCPAWWKHPEAVARFSVMWRAFEHLKQDPALGLSTWWLHHADPHLRALMDPDRGPFVLCDPREGHSDRPPEPLPIEASPPAMWDDPVYSVRRRGEARSDESAAGAA